MRISRARGLEDAWYWAGVSDKRRVERAPVCVVSDIASQINQFARTLDSLLMNVIRPWHAMIMLSTSLLSTDADVVVEIFRF